MTALPSASPGNGRPGARRPFEGLGATLAHGLARTTALLVSGSSRLLGDLRERGGHALGDFRARPEHSRWRAYALGGYASIVLATFAGQLYSENPLGAYVRIQRVEMPLLTQVFIRNDSNATWRSVRITLNGVYGYEPVRPVEPKVGYLMLPVERFALYDKTAGRFTFAPKSTKPKTLLIECDQGRFETELP